MSRLIEDSNEFIFYIQDLYDVLSYEPYKKMLTNALLKVLYVPVVLQSLCVLEMKPKLQIQTCIYLLTQSLLVLKHEPLVEAMIALTMSTEITKEFKDYLE